MDSKYGREEWGDMIDDQAETLALYREHGLVD